MDEINISKLHVRANHGVFVSEKELGQNFYLDIKIKLNYYPATINEDLNKSVHYGELADFCIAEFTSVSYDLIETAAIKLADAVLNTYQLIEEIEITVHKPEAPVAHSFDDIAVKTIRRRSKAYVALGSNIGDSKKYFDYALNHLNENEAIKVLRESKRITTKAYGLEDQADFLNSIVEIETYMSAVDLLRELNKIEQECDRRREIHWGPRTLDLDILLYNDEQIYEENLIVPHYDMHNRKFIISAMCELAPYFVHPRLNATMDELLKQLS